MLSGKVIWVIPAKYSLFPQGPWGGWDGVGGGNWRAQVECRNKTDKGLNVGLTPSFGSNRRFRRQALPSQSRGRLKKAHSPPGVGRNISQFLAAVYWQTVSNKIAMGAAEAIAVPEGMVKGGIP